MLRRLWPEPVAVKVPEILVVFWIVKILTTAGGEATSDYLAHAGNVVGGGTELLVFVVGLVLQFGTRRYRAVSYWFLAYAIAIFGCGVADFLHLDVHIPYAGTSVLWAAVLAGIFVLWYRLEGTLSIHSVTTRRRELFYWSAVFATFALGTALGDYTAIALNIGYLASAVLFGVAFAVPVVGWRLGMSPVVAFWACYVLTRPFGASVADYVAKPTHASGLGVGDGTTVAVLTVAVVGLVAYLAVARPDVEPGSRVETVPVGFAPPPPPASGR